MGALGLVSVEKISAELHQVLGVLDAADLVHALELVDQAERTLPHAAQGSQRPEAGQAPLLLAHTKQQRGETCQTITAARGMVGHYIGNLVGN